MKNGTLKFPRLCLSICFSLAIYFAGCKDQSAIDGEIIRKVTDPNSAVSALLIRSGYGATVSWVYSVYLQPTEDKRFNEVFRADKAEGLTLFWKDNNELVIKMKCGRIFAFQNFFDLLEKNGKVQRRIAVTLYTTGLCS